MRECNVMNVKPYVSNIVNITVCDRIIIKIKCVAFKIYALG